MWGRFRVPDVLVSSCSFDVFGNIVMLVFLFVFVYCGVCVVGVTNGFGILKIL